MKLRRVLPRSVVPEVELAALNGAGARAVRVPWDRLQSAVAGSRRRVVDFSGWPSLTQAEQLLHVGAVIVALSLLCMVTVDRPIALYMKQSVTGDLMVLWKHITQLGVATGYVIVALLLLYLGRIAQRVAAHQATAEAVAQVRRYATLLLAALAASGLVVNLLKIAFGRLRPKFLFEQNVYAFQPLNFDTGDNTFPSGHSQVIWVLAAVLCLAFPRHRTLFITIAVVVALSRVIVSVHFVSDVLVGSYLGVASVLLLAPWILRRQDGSASQR